MILDDQFVNSVSVKRSIQTGPMGTTYEIVEAAVPCLIQPVVAEFYSTTGFVFGRTYNAYFDIAADVQINDQLTDQDGKLYSVTGSMNRGYGTTIPHLTLLLTEQTQATPDQ